ncbi:aminoglycoside phosphotransferase family protein [Auraticoccus monumenti]|uniref:Streptomycin 6-kinase n=1 Tax=Auraticoccus monumenti TaxID=675864 RepID=A0A1G7D949_9ACTN|nr:aminoglycoside phosphotransferase family protein [Auraticoccus monumenti]SDE48178.1 streptomycin 6-kinase [Auraticoccus monumenti]
MVEPLVVPAGLRSRHAHAEPWASWLDALPRRYQELVAEWGLRPDGETRHGWASVVVPVRDADGRACALKLGGPDPETEHEALALQHWAGDGTVLLYRADPRRRAMLLERLDPTDLLGLDDVTACEVVAGFYPRLHRPAPPRLRPLTSFVARWTEELAALPRDAAVPHRLVEQAVSLGRDLVDDPASVGTMVHTDLHDENVLAGEREPWLVIDPIPLSGDPCYELAPMVWNRWRPGDPDARTSARRRFHTLVDVSGLDEDRCRDWVVVRMLHNALWAVQDALRTGRAPDHDELTMCVSVAKAVQD